MSSVNNIVVIANIQVMIACAVDAGSEFHVALEANVKLLYKCGGV